MSSETPSWESRIRSLIDKSARGRASLLAGPPRPPYWLGRQTYASAIGQFLRGELAAARICRRLARDLPHPLAARFLLLQAAEEDHHAALYAEYLDRLGGAESTPAALTECLDECLAARVPPTDALAAMTVLLEGESLSLHQVLRRWFGCHVLRRLVSVVDRDESRHIAFGRIYLAQHVPLVPSDQRAAGFRWLEGLWVRSIGEQLGRGVASRRARQRYTGDRWGHHRRVLLDLGYIDPAERPRRRGV